MAELATDLLRIWERGIAASPVERGVLMLSLAVPDRSLEDLARVSIGARDALLLTLRERSFGPRMTGRVACPACATELELEFAAAQVRAAPCRSSSVVVAHAGYEVSVRLLDSTDLAMISAADGVATNAAVLLERCVVGARADGEAVLAAALPVDVTARICEQLSAADPQSDVQIAAECPDCAHRWDAPLDIAAYLWTEIHGWACRMLRDIHQIASAYGWSEQEIVALGATRRQIYLDLIER